MLEKLQTVTGLFYEPQRLFATLRELVSFGVAADDMCIFGTKDVMLLVGSMLKNQPDGPTDLAALFLETTPFRETCFESTLVGSQGSLNTLLSSAINGDRKERPQYRHGGSALYLSCYSRFIADGCLMIVVVANEPLMLSQVSAAMLRHSTQSVQTNELLLA